MNIGRIIRDFRKERGVTLSELGEKMEVSPSYLSAIERNIRRPSVQILKKIGDILDIPVNILLSSEDDMLTGKKLRLLRESRSLSLEDLSEISDIPVKLLAKLEDGKEIPDMECLKKLSEGLNVTINYFLVRNANNNLGSRLKKIRTDRNVTIAVLAEKAGITPGLISQIENGQTTPHLVTLETIAKVLNTSPAYLLMEGRDIEGILKAFSPDMLDVLGDPNVQAILRSLRDLRASEIKYIVNYIYFFKQNSMLLYR